MSLKLENFLYCFFFFPPFCLLLVSVGSADASRAILSNIDFCLLCGNLMVRWQFVTAEHF